MLIYIIIIVGGILIDQLTKYAAILYLEPISQMPLIPNVFHLTYIENAGAAFGMMSGWQYFLIVFSFLTVGALCYVFFHTPRERRFIAVRLSLCFIISGAVGNLIDRLRFKYVVDFLDFRLIGFPIFNVADIFVVLGGLLLAYVLIKKPILIDVLIIAMQKPKKKKTSSSYVKTGRLEGLKKQRSRPIKKRRPDQKRNAERHKRPRKEPQVYTTIEDVTKRGRITFTPTPPSDTKKKSSKK
ncbi:MAG: signal peptidase II [Eubacteriaceae bacterium]|jgi:signal peptidase II|nr:signal peptidase II [Eubacteriaceae bacterium]